jgi:uncharacterized protein GlcG (DUF336 family)
MSKQVLMWLVVSASVTSLNVQAQTPPAKPAAASLPARAPYDIPYGMPINLHDATRVLDAVLASSNQHGWPEAVAITDPNGDLITFAKMDNTQNASPSIALRKAATAARFRRETRTFFNGFETGHSYSATLDPLLAASPGGYPLISGGKIVGAVGCSGGTGDQDALVCKAGVDALK